MRCAIWFAVIADRAGSEGYLKNNTVPQGAEVISRRTQLNLLRSEGLWEAMEENDRDALSMADGHWSWQQINAAAATREEVRLLRWILRLDHFLALVEHQLRPPFNIAHELVIDPTPLRAKDDLIEWGDSFVASEACKQFFFRCHAESIARGNIQPPNDDGSAWAREVSAELAGKHHEDWVIGTKLVSEIDEETLSLALGVAGRRMKFLEGALELLAGGPIPEKLPVVFTSSVAVETES